MIRTIDNSEKLSKYTSALLTEILEEVAKKVKQKIQDRIMLDVYLAGNPVAYPDSENYNRSYKSEFRGRTGDLYNSVVAELKKYGRNNVKLTVYHDEDMFTYDPEHFIHGSEYSGNVAEFLPDWINFGTEGGMFGSGWYSEARPYMNNALKELIQGGLIDRWIQEELKERGFTLNNK